MSVMLQLGGLTTSRQMTADSSKREATVPASYNCFGENIAPFEVLQGSEWGRSVCRKEEASYYPLVRGCGMARPKKGNCYQ